MRTQPRKVRSPTEPCLSPGGTSGINLKIARSFARLWLRERSPSSRTEWQEVGTGNSPSSDPQQTGNDRQETVLVVDDDLTLQSMILDYFVDNNIRTLLASGRKEMLRHLSAQEVNVVILDLRLELEDGLDVLRELRSSSDVPVIVITGQRRDEIDRVVGLELGADDYVTKPFNLRELLARVRAIIRRLDRARSSPAREPERGGYRFSGWQLPLRTRRLTDPNGGDVALTKGEYALLVAFLDAPQRPLSREHLYRRRKSTKTCSIVALTCKLSTFDANWNTTRARRR